ncbi:hypothetical protein [Nocardia asteroides]|uniref:hypothetical protein n=1 Tax=Nocardia asteroides TaxID=1824 RepID=UPI003402DD41
MTIENLLRLHGHDTTKRELPDGKLAFDPKGAPMTDICKCPPDDCHGGHTMNIGPARLTDEQLRRLTDYVHPDETTDYVRPWLHSMAAELLALRPRVAELEADSIDRDFGIQAMSIAPGESTLSTTPTTERARRLVLAMSLACGRMLDEDQAPNYVEFEVSPAGHPGYVVHVRRAEGRSPHTLRRDAEARAERAETRVAELEAAQREPSGYVVGWMESDDRVNITLDESEPPLGGPDTIAYPDLSEARAFLAEIAPEDPDTAFRVYALREVAE